MNPQVATLDVKRKKKIWQHQYRSSTKSQYGSIHFGQRNKPTPWFCQLESQFELNKIVQDTTKYWYVVSQLVKFAQEVEYIITQPPQTDKYNTIKNELIKRVSTPRHTKKNQKLLVKQEIEDRTPTQHLRHLSGRVGDEFLKVVWLNSLLVDMENILLT